MTFSKAVHLIEQFAAQAPFAVWITDSRGISIFANKKLHELFGIPEHPSGAHGFDLFDDTGVKGLGLSDVAKRARAGEVIDMIVEIPRPGELQTHIESARTAPLIIRAVCYPLRSSSQKIEHYVILITDVTETSRHRQELKTQLHDLSIYNKSREARLERLNELEGDVARLEKEIRDRGAAPAA
jgi:hypothetical protein